MPSSKSKKTQIKKIRFPKYTLSEYTDGLMHGVLLKYKKCAPADVAVQIHAEVALIKARAEARYNHVAAKLNEDAVKAGA